MLKFDFCELKNINEKNRLFLNQCVLVPNVTYINYDEKYTLNILTVLLELATNKFLNSFNRLLA